MAWKANKDESDQSVETILLYISRMSTQKDVLKHNFGVNCKVEVQEIFLIQSTL